MNNTIAIFSTHIVHKINMGVVIFVYGVNYFIEYFCLGHILIVAIQRINVNYRNRKIQEIFFDDLNRYS